jgi:hypothetical protein
VNNEWSARLRKWLPTAILVLTIIFVAAVRLRIADTPLERDEGEFAYAGQLIRQGHIPYNYLYNIKLPGTYAAYAAIMTFFGETPVGIHLGLLLVNVASIVLIYLLGKKLADATAGAIAAVFFALLTLDPGLYGFAAHATHFVVLFALGGFYFLLRAIETERRLNALFSGICMGISFVCKQPGMAFGVMAFGFFVWLAARRGKPALRMYYAIGWLAPYAAVCVVMWIGGTFDLFWLWTVNYAAAHSRPVSDMLPWLHSAWQAAPPRLQLVALALFIAVIFVSMQRGIFLWKRIFLLAIALSGGTAVTAGFYYYLHYFIMLIPAVALVLSITVTEFSNRLRTSAPGTWLPAVPIIGLAIWALVFVELLRDYLFVNSPDTIVATRYVGNPFVQTRKIGEYLRSHSQPNARIAVLESEPEIFVYAHRSSSTGYIYAYDMTAPGPARFEIEQNFKRALIASDPDYVVFVCAPFAWTPQDAAGLALADWCYAFANAHYTRVAIADGLTPTFQDTIYKWDAEALNYKRCFPQFIEVYRRNDARAVTNKQ